MKFVVIIICHIVGLVLFLWMGFSLNEKISNDYAGVITVFSIASQGKTISQVLNQGLRRFSTEQVRGLCLTWPVRLNDKERRPYI